MTNILILHETDGRPYFKALEHSFSRDTHCRIMYRESSVARLLLWDLIVAKLSPGRAIKKALKNLFFRLWGQFNYRGTCILCFAPYDFRLIVYLPLVLSNRCIFHTSWPEWEGPRFPRGGNVLNRKLYKKLMSERECIAVTQNALRSVESFCPASKLLNIPHSVNFSVSPDVGVSERREKRACFVGKLVPEKGVNVLIGLAELMADWEFCIVGDGPLSIQLLTASKQIRNLRVFGLVSDRRRLKSIVSSSSILLLPSLKTSSWEELFGIVIIEALSVRTSVLASRHCGPETILTGKLPECLIDEYAWTNKKSIRRLIEQAAKLSGDYLLTTVAEEYLVENVSKRWRLVIKQDDTIFKDN